MRFPILVLERAIGGTALALMLILLAFSVGAPIPVTASPPIQIVPTPALIGGGAPIRAPERQEAPAALPAEPSAAEAPAEAPPVVDSPPPAEPPAPAVEIAPAPAQNDAAATIAVQESKLVVEPDGSVRLPGVEDWMVNLMPEPAPTPIPAADGPPPPRGGCGPRCGWRPRP